tara:strand:+ start:967 stop:1323 length:357 start_codon:yes stop_codon:yes gene_type:complete
MKKLTLSIGLLAGILSSNAQDTTRTVAISDNHVFEWKYKHFVLLKEYVAECPITIKLDKNEVIELWLYQNKGKKLQLLTTFYDGKTRKDTLKAINNKYFTLPNTKEVEVDCENCDEID